MAKPEPINFKEMKEDLEKTADVILRECLDKEDCNTYEPTKSQDMIHLITEKCIEKLPAIYKTYKFTATCTLINTKEGGLHMASSCYWDNETDGNVYVKLNKGILCFILNIFALH